MPELLIYDEIVSPTERKLWGVGVDAESFAAQLKDAGDGDLTIGINSPGGSAWEGMAMHSLLQAERAKGRKVTVRIDGACLSAATLPAAAADEVRASGVCEFMIHNPSLRAFGDAGDMRKAADRLDVTKAATLAAYRGKTGHSDETLSALMTAETWLTPEKAKELRFVDVVESSPEKGARMAAAPWTTRPLRHPAAVAAYERMSARAPSLSPQGVPSMPTPTPTPTDAPAVELVPKAEMAAVQTERDTVRAQLAAVAPLLTQIAALTSETEPAKQQAKLSEHQQERVSLQGKTKELCFALARARNVAPAAMLGWESLPLEVLEQNAHKAQPTTAFAPGAPAGGSAPDAPQDAVVEITHYDRLHFASAGITDEDEMRTRKAAAQKGLSR